MLSKNSKGSIYHNFQNYETQRCSDILDDNFRLGHYSSKLLPILNKQSSTIVSAHAGDANASASDIAPKPMSSQGLYTTDIVNDAIKRKQLKSAQQFYCSSEMRHYKAQVERELKEKYKDKIPHNFKSKKFLKKKVNANQLKMIN